MTVTNTALFSPVMAMVTLTIVVMFVLFKRRVPALMKIKPSAEDLQKRTAINELPAPATYAAENFSNLFEVPVLFYVVCLGAMVTESGDSDISLGLAWVYVALRIVHSFIHCGTNNVMRRFQVFALSNFVLIGLLGSVIFEFYLR